MLPEKNPIKVCFVELFDVNQGRKRTTRQNITSQFINNFMPLFHYETPSLSVVRKNVKFPAQNVPKRLHSIGTIGPCTIGSYCLFLLLKVPIFETKYCFFVFSLSIVFWDFTYFFKLYFKTISRTIRQTKR